MIPTHGIGMNFRAWRTARRVLGTAFLLCAGLAWPAAAQDSEPEPEPTIEVWDDSDTAIANHYIQSLQQTPEFGKVLDLLWDHYEKHGQVRLLLQYFDQAAQAPDALSAKLINGHLLRKKGNAEAAMEAYEAVFAQAPDNVFVVRALAETHRAAGHAEQAAEFFGQLAKLEGPGAESWTATQLARADLARELKRVDEAVAIWLETLERRPGDLELRKQIVAQLLEEGRTAEAIQIYEALTEDGDPERRLLAMKELGRLYEFVDDFDHAIEIYEEALGTIHFKHFLHDEFAGRLVRVYERFSRVEELETAWLKAAEGENPTEELLLRVVKFYEFTADPREQESWLTRLVDRVPANSIYRQLLAELFIQNDKYDDAKALLDVLAEELKPTPVTIALAQAKVSLSVQGNDAAEQLLTAYLETTPPTREGLQRLLRFSQTHYLDGLTERLLKDQQANGWSEEGEIPEMKLAAFHHERGRLQKVRETLEAYVAAAPTDQQRGERLLRVAEAYRNLRMLPAAQAAVAEAQELGQAKREHFLVLAETFVELHDTESAIENFQKVWELSTRNEQRVEVDQRIFSVLRATGGEDTLEGGSPPAEVAGEPWSGLWQFYDYLKTTATLDQAPKNRFRVAWWAIRVENYSEAYKQLPQLHNPADPVLEYEEMLLDLAERTENRALVLRQLELIARIDPDREEEFLVRKALTRLELGFEDEAVRTLRNLVDRPDSSLTAVQALAKAYKQQDRTRALEDLWSAAFKKADLLERRQIIKPYTNTLIELGRIEDALAAQSELIDAETDLAQRRKLLEDQLSFSTSRYLLEDWMLPRYAELARQHPLDRFFPEALARIHLALGDTDAAFAALKRAYYMSNNDTDLLEQLGELASKSSDLKAAIYYQRQLIASEDDETSPDEWLALIERLEDDLRVNEADLTRRRLESKFGQDPDFLRQLGNHYLNGGDHDAARRILERVAALRPWDAENLLELGLLTLELGEDERAAEVFNRLLEATDEAAPALDSKLEKLPFAAANRSRPVPGQAVGLGLESYAEIVESFELLPDDWRDRISEWLREAKPEFSRKPGDVRSIRLRAIEELALLAGPDPAWRKRWDDASTAAVTERIWALSHAKIHGPTQQLLDDHIRPLTAQDAEISRWDFLYVLQTLRSGEIKFLDPWLAGEKAREACVMLGIQLLLRDPDYVFEDVRLREAVGLVEMTVDQVRLNFHSLQRDGRLPEARQFAAVAAGVNELDDYRLSVDLASLCARLGLRDERRHWLESAFSHFGTDRKVVGYAFFDTVQGLFRLQSTAEGQRQVIEAVQSVIANIPAEFEAERIEVEIWLALAARQPQLALQRVRNLVESREEMRKSYRSFRYVRGPVTPEAEHSLEIELWRQLAGTLTLLAGSVPREDLAELTEAIDHYDLREPRDVAAAAQYDEFRSLRLLWRLESANPPERARLIEDHLAGSTNEEDSTELARSLDSRGLGADALPVYRKQIERRSTDFNNVRGYLNACRQAQAYGEASSLLEGYLGGRLQKPESMTEAYIHRNHSNFLYLAEDVEQLARIAQIQSGAEFAEVIQDKQIRAFYQRYLITLYRKEGDFDAAIRVLKSMSAGEALTREDRMTWANVLEEKGDHAAAIGMLEHFPLTGRDPAEAEIVRRLGELHAASENPDAAKLIELGKRSLDYPESITLAREMAEHLAAAGRTAVADSILTLKARSVQIEGARFDLLLSQLKLRLAADDDELTGRTVQQLLGSWTGIVDDAELFLGVVEESSGSHTKFWRDALEKGSRPRKSRALAEAARVFVGGDNPTLEDDASPSEMRVTVRALMDNSEEPAAAKVLTGFHALGRSDPLDDAELAIELFSRLEDRPALAEWCELARLGADTPTRMAQVANAFAANGRLELALSVFQAQSERLRVLTVDQQYFLEQYATALMTGGDFAEAERVLMDLFHKPIGGDPDLLVDLYGKWGRLGEIDSALRKFYLNPATADDVVESSARFPEHRGRREVDDDLDSQFDSPDQFRSLRPYRF